ncbi:MAG TPA: response regulator [Pontiellaceae bacterium]|mgnify:CR=1 FL=1|nr:response regulator [Pontiellaceae bacterium]
MDRKKILLVDDEEAIRKMVRAVLGSELYEFAEAANGIAAQAILEKQKFALVISDVIMPDCDGIELVMAIRRKLPEIKIIVMSGGGRVRAGHYLDLARKLGATRVFEKPFDTAELRQTVHDLLS